MKNQYVVKIGIGKNCFLSSISGDPGRTLRIGNAKRYKTENAAKAALTRARNNNPHRVFSGEIIYLPHRPPYKRKPEIMFKNGEVHKRCTGLCKTFKPNTIEFFGKNDGNNLQRQCFSCKARYVREKKREKLGEELIFHEFYQEWVGVNYTPNSSGRKKKKTFKEDLIISEKEIKDNKHYKFEVLSFRKNKKMYLMNEDNNKFIKKLIKKGNYGHQKGEGICPF